MKGIIIRENEDYYTFLNKIFISMDNLQMNYNWLITSHECYPQSKEYAKMLAQNYCWISGEKLTDMINTENFQWIWGVFSAFSPKVEKGKVLQYPFPQAEGYEKIWSNPVSLQHPYSEIEIIAWDSSLTVIIAKENRIVEKIMQAYPLCQYLEEYNRTN